MLTLDVETALGSCLSGPTHMLSLLMEKVITLPREKKQSL